MSIEPPMTDRKRYKTDLTDKQWAIIAPLIPPQKLGGRPRKVNMREILNTLFYQNRTGCQWDLLPHDLLPKSTVFDYYSQWQVDGTFQLILDTLRRTVREQEAPSGEPEPSLMIIDSQSVKTTETGGVRGYDGNKKINGRKRHKVVDSLGLLIAVTVTAANIDDAAAAQLVLAKLTRENSPRLQKIMGDKKYHNHDLYAWVDKHFEGKVILEPTTREKETKGFVPIPKRWVVEQANGCHGRYRRNSKDYERKTTSSETRINLAGIDRLLNRIEPREAYKPLKYRAGQSHPVSG